MPLQEYLDVTLTDDKERLEKASVLPLGLHTLYTKLHLFA